MFLLSLLCLLGTAGSLRAAEPELQSVMLRRTEESVEVDARLRIRITDTIEQALLKGVPLYFVWQADLMRERWYWRDKRLSTSYRTWRLAYQTLTRRWRLSLSTEAPGVGQQFALHQTYESLDNALIALGRVSRWALPESARLDADDIHRVDLAFRLDLGLLPRPLQIGVANSAEWAVRWQRSLPVPARIEPAEPKVEPAVTGEER